MEKLFMSDTILIDSKIIIVISEKFGALHSDLSLP
jgi:hypothetical protein